MKAVGIQETEGSAIVFPFDTGEHLTYKQAVAVSLVNMDIGAIPHNLPEVLDFIPIKINKEKFFERGFNQQGVQR